MSWRDHLTNHERLTLSLLESARSDAQERLGNLSKEIARMRNVCVLRQRRRKLLTDESEG